MVDTSSPYEPLARLARALSLIGRLPAVATTDWCERAARCLLTVHPSIAAAVTVGDVGPGGVLLNIEATGGVIGATAEPIVPTPLACVRPASLGWWWPRPTSKAAGLLDDIGQREAWISTGAGRAWMRLGVTELLVGSSMLHVELPSRQLIIEIGATIGSRPLDRADAEILRAMLDALSHRALLAFGSAPLDPADRITEREQEVLEHVVLGKTVKQIAAELSRSPHTIHDHVKSLHRKLSANTRGELVGRALGFGRMIATFGMFDDEMSFENGELAYSATT